MFATRSLFESGLLTNVAAAAHTRPYSSINFLWSKLVISYTRRQQTLWHNVGKSVKKVTMVIGHTIFLKSCLGFSFYQKYGLIWQTETSWLIFLHCSEFLKCSTQFEVEQEICYQYMFQNCATRPQH